jgi:hypothetical protein
MVDGLNFKDFVSFLSTFSAKASLQQKIECNAHVWISVLQFVMDSLVLMITLLLVLICSLFYWAVIFKVYDIDGKGKVTFKDLVEVLRDLTGSSMSEQQREVLISYKPVFHWTIHSLARKWTYMFFLKEAVLINCRFLQRYRSVCCMDIIQFNTSLYY